MNDEQDNGTLRLIAIAIIVYLLLAGGGGSAAPFTATEPDVFVAFDDDAVATEKLDHDHPGQADVMTSLADDSVRTWVTKTQGGKWENYGIKSAPPDRTMQERWFCDAYDYWVAKGNKQVPYIVAAGPHGRGYAGAFPDGDIKTVQDATRKLLVPIAK